LSYGRSVAAIACSEAKRSASMVGTASWTCWWPPEVKVTTPADVAVDDYSRFRPRGDYPPPPRAPAQRPGPPLWAAAAAGM